MTSQKTTINDFLNNPFYKWRPLLLSIAQMFTKKYEHDEGKYSVLIIDDTSKKKTGKFVEALSRFMIILYITIIKAIKWLSQLGAI